MTHDRIKQLAQLLPADAGIFTAGRQPGTAPPGLAERIAIAVNDPGFGHKFIMEFVTRGEPMPPSVHEMALRRAYSHFAGENLIPDNLMLAVEQLGLPANEFIRHVLNALLVCRDITYDQIAEHLGIDAQAVRVYAELHWNVRDRAAEAAYIAKIVFPSGRFQSMKTDGMEGMTIAQRLLVAGHQFGTREVLFLSGMNTDHKDPPSVEQSLKEFEASLLNNAVQLARTGGLNSKTAPGISHARSLLVARRNSDSAKTERASRALPDISIGQGILISLGKEEEAKALAEGEANFQKTKEWLREHHNG